MEKHIKIALVGNPNAGKSSLFNCLTGLNQKVGNFPGVTVDKKTGYTTLANGQKARVMDLPGTYSLYPTSPDERIVLNILTSPAHEAFPDVLVYVADSTDLERHLLLLTQVKDLGLPVVLALNMMDVAEQKGIDLNTNLLSKELGMPVLRINARNGQGISELKAAVRQLTSDNTAGEASPVFFPDRDFFPEMMAEAREITHVKNTYCTLLRLHHASTLPSVGAGQKEQLEQLRRRYDFNSVRWQVQETMHRFSLITPLVQRATICLRPEQESLTEKADRLITHPVLGTLLFITILFLLFQSIFAWASYPMDLIDESINLLSETLKAVLPEHLLTDLLTEGILAGLGGILVFVPQIAILFGLIAILEETGYMSRAVFLFDRLMRNVGLSGRSVVSLISGAACAIPAIMATRTITHWRERLITILVTPFISCSARIPVYAVLVAFVVPQEASLWIFNMQGLVVMGLYVLGVGAALTSAWVLKKVLRSNEKSFFVMELPSYQMPHWRNVWFTVVEKVKAFVFEAGRVIIVIAMVLWFLASFGPGERMETAAEAATQEAAIAQLDQEATEALVASRRLQASYAGHFGKFIEPAIAPLGFDWKIGIALLTSFAAREVFVGTMATIYSVGSEDEATIREKLAAEVNPETGEKVFNRATAFSLMIFYVLAMQCMSTLAIVRRETGTWKWPMLQLVLMTATAWLGSFIAYQLLS